jgi:hypothetical protein
MSSFKTGTGFSIELEDFYLEARGTHEGLPLYEALGGKVTAIAIVDKPAIKVGTIGNDIDRTLTGPVMIPDLRIFRTTGLNGKEKCYWYFSAETIKKLQETFEGQMKIGH